MPGSGGDPSAVAVPVEMFGGLVLDVTPTALPHGVSPDCQDAKFTDGVVGTRPGLTSQYTIAGNPTINYQKTFETALEVPRFLSLTSAGLLQKDSFPGGPLTPIFSGILPNLFGKSTSFNGREYLAFGDGINGQDLPRQYDDVNFDRVTQDGPGAAPSVADENISTTISTSPVGIVPVHDNVASAAVTSSGPDGSEVTIGLVSGALNGLQVSDTVILTTGSFQVTTLVAGPAGIGNITGFKYVDPTGALPAVASAIATQLFQVTTTTPNNLTLGQLATVTGTGVGGYNGTWNTRFVLTASIEQLGPAPGFTPGTNTTTLGNSTAGTLSNAGNISAGVRQVSVFFKMRDGSYTQPAPPTTYTSGTNKRAVVTNIAVGWPGVVARVLTFTAAGGSSFRHLGPTGLTIPNSNMVIADNTTRTALIDFNDGTLLLGTDDDPLFEQIVLPQAAGVIDFDNRLFWWGVRNNLQNLVNMGFDGGFTGPSLPFEPLGWIPDPVFGPGGTSALANGDPVVYGDAYSIVGNGTTATRGLIRQSLYQDALGNPICLPLVAYSVRVRIRQNATLTQGQIYMATAGTGRPDHGIAIAANPANTGYKMYEFAITPADGWATIPPDFVLFLEMIGTPTLNGSCTFDSIEIFPTNAPVNASDVLASTALGGAEAQSLETYNPTTGKMQVALGNGQGMRAAFKIRKNLYFVKEHSLWVTQASGTNEPALWEIDNVSTKVGTPSVNGVGIGEDWVVIAHRTGLYIFWSGEPIKIMQEIQALWDTINWNAGKTIAVVVDTKKRRIYVAMPLGAATQPNKTIVLDYHDVGGAEQIAGGAPITVGFAGRKRAVEKARKWCPWTISANSIAQIERANGQTEVYFGSNDGTGNINLLDENAKTDNGTNIPFYYTTAPFVEEQKREALQLAPGRLLFTYLQLFGQGSGLLSVTVYNNSLGFATALNPFTLSAAQFLYLEMMTDVAVEQLFYKFAASGVGSWVNIQEMVISCKNDPAAPVAGAR